MIKANVETLDTTAIFMNERHVKYFDISENVCYNK